MRNILVSRHLRSCRSYDEEGKIVLDWYKHYPQHPYRGFTVMFAFLCWALQVTFVSDRKAYEDLQARFSNTKVNGWWLFPWGKS